MPFEHCSETSNPFQCRYVQFDPRVSAMQKNHVDQRAVRPSLVDAGLVTHSTIRAFTSGGDGRSQTEFRSIDDLSPIGLSRPSGFTAQTYKVLAVTW